MTYYFLYFCSSSRKTIYILKISKKLSQSLNDFQMFYYIIKYLNWKIILLAKHWYKKCENDIIMISLEDNYYRNNYLMTKENRQIILPQQ